MTDNTPSRVAEARMARMARAQVLITLGAAALIVVLVGVGLEASLSQNRTIQRNQTDTHSLLTTVQRQAAVLHEQSATVGALRTSLSTLIADSQVLRQVANTSAMRRQADEQFFYAICQGIITSPNTSAGTRHVLRQLSACQAPK